MKNDIISNMESMSNNDKNIYNDDVSWNIIGSYFDGKHLKQLVRHQLESYNDFVTYQIQKTISMFNPVQVRSEQDYIAKVDKYRLEMYINFDNFSIHRPQIHENNGATKIMFPQEARLRNFTYASNMTLDLNVKYIVRNGASLELEETFYKKLPNIHLGKLPIMLKSCICILEQYKHIHNSISGECKLDAGGYFIINGSEKTCLGQERAAENQVQCFNISKGNTKWSWVAELKSVPDFKCISPKQISLYISSKNNGFGNGMSIQIPRVKVTIPLFVLFRAMGVLSDKEICSYIILDINEKINEDFLLFLRGSIVEANKILTQEDAINYITNNVMYTPMNMDRDTGIKKKKEFTMEVLETDLFPHCKTNTQKLYFLGYMVNKLIRCYFGINKIDDRDAYDNKRIDLTGILLNNLFRNYFNKVVKDMQKQIVREINSGSWRSTEDYYSIINLTNIYKIVKSTTIENGLKRALATGDFGIKHTNSNKVGVAQVLNRLTYISTLSHLRRINTPIDKSGKLIPPRKLHNTSWGFLCCAETPEGSSVGVVKNISYMTHITIPSNSSALYEYVEPYVIKLEDATNEELFKGVKVFINGVWLGVAKDAEELFKDVKEKKYKGIINIYTSIVFNVKDKEIKICNDAGRLIRPVLRVNNNKLLITEEHVRRLKNKTLKWEDMVLHLHEESSFIEYVDPAEQNTSMIAVNYEKLNLKEQIIYKYTHCEIHPSTIFGILASCIPFPEHNQSPRNTYQCLDINTPVLMKDQSYKLIKDIKVGDEVQTFDSETMKTSYTSIVNQYVRETEKDMYSVKTHSGKSFNATFDHKFMTSEGWKEVEYLEANKDLIGIKPVQKEASKICDYNLIINNEIFKKELMDYVDNKLINKYIDKLEEIKLLPLYSNNTNLPILARIFGYILADGSLTYHARDKTFMLQADFGEEYGAELFEMDIDMVGLKQVKIREGIRTFNNTTHHTWSVNHQGIIGCLIKSLGMIYGKKTIQKSNDIPEWIKNGSDLIKREFLAGIFGGDGCQIRFNKLHKKGYNYICGPLMMSNKSEFKESLLEQILKIKMMNSISIMLNSFNIINKVFCKNNTKEKDRYNIGIELSNRQNNLIDFYDTIGYRYDIRKITKSGIIVEYLKYKMILIENHVKEVEKVRELYDTNYNITEISNETNISNNKISSIIRSYKNNRKISCPNLKDDNIENFINKCKIINDSIFVPIISKDKIKMNLISDITTESETHSFIIKGGIMTHNCAMGKQAIGVYVTNFDNRMDKTAYVLTYPTRPLVDTRIMNMIQLNEIPSGTQVIVAIMTHTGYNQEDSVLMNKGSIDRGLFQATIYHTEKDEDKKIHGDEEIRCNPDPSKTKGMKYGNYGKVNSNGVIPENTLLENRDIIIAKVQPIKEARNDHTKVTKYEDQSRIYRTNEECYIDKNYIDRNGDGYNFCKVRVRSVRKPVIGDKISSRHGQKGTIGNIIPEEDMPFTEDGVRPDIIINPHAIPSRMTIAQLKETLLGKVLLELGLFGDGTSFGNLRVEDICDKLNNLGYESKGNELLYNGLTGEQHESSIFIGPVFYQRLKHMVVDKQHSRSIGPMVNLTRQPAEGRSRDGGLRYGEMERDCMCSHGAAAFNQGRLYHASDAYSVHVCKRCGMIAAFNNTMNIHICKTCDNRKDFDYVEIPYACKLMFQELITMNIAPRIIT